MNLPAPSPQPLFFQQCLERRERAFPAEADHFVVPAPAHALLETGLRDAEACRAAGFRLQRDFERHRANRVTVGRQPEGVGHQEPAAVEFGAEPSGEVYGTTYGSGTTYGEYGHEGYYDQSGDVYEGGYAPEDYGIDGGYDGSAKPVSGDPNYRARRHRPSANDTNVGSLEDFAEYGGYNRYTQARSEERYGRW